MTQRDQPVAANVPHRDCVPAAQDQRSVPDTSEFVIPSSARLYPAAVPGFCSRFLVGCSISAANDRHRVTLALQVALQRRRPPLALLHHSD